jgi:catechol 2,3-dioxygenase-like lactoylglutathione lyase family enzyme
MKIKELIIYTDKLNEQLDFYVDVLELQLLKRTSQSGSLKIGSSILTFKWKENVRPYHFAFNIPSNKENEALIWLKKRVKVLSFEGNEIADFKNWNAKAIYFYDEDLNIVEFISRKDLRNYNKANFSSKSILNISEIGMATTQIEKTYYKLNEIQKIDVFDGNFERFCAIGNDEGMFILVNPKMKKWFPTDDEVFLSDFELVGDYNFEFVNGKINQIT